MTNSLRPVLVYLDSQDFITLSKELYSGETAALERLVSMRESGKAEFGLSLFHIAEVLNPDSPGFESYQACCGEVMYRLTLGKAFPYISDVLAGKNYPSETGWLPELDISILNKSLSATFIRKTVNELLISQSRSC